MLLEGQGFGPVYNMAGGIRAWEGATAAGPPDMGLYVLRGDETPAGFTAAAYGLEEGLRTFYLAMAGRTADNDSAGLFSRLAGYEEGHQDRIYELYRSLAPDPLERPSFEASALTGVMEGGFSTESFLAEHRAALSSTADTLDLALSLEAQALDLYLRFTGRAADPKTRGAIFQIAEEEKMHLKELGRLRGRKI